MSYFGNSPSPVPLNEQQIADAGDPRYVNVSGDTISGNLQINGSITATSFSGDGSSLTGIVSIPSGVIVMWSGSEATIPSGWVLCNGSNSTPDLRNRFVVGAGDSYAVNATGGTETVTLSESQIPSHTHSFSATTSSDGSHTHTGSTNTTGSHTHTITFVSGVGGNQGGDAFGSVGGTISTSSDGAHSHSLTINSGGSHTHTISGTTGASGTGGSHENRPPYYALCYIMKT